MGAKIKKVLFSLGKIDGGGKMNEKSADGEDRERIKGS